MNLSMLQPTVNPDLFGGNAEMSRLMRAHDWSATPVGPVNTWPQALKIVVRILLDSRYAMWLGWGPEFTFFYNDAYAQMTLGAKHPWALGRSAREVWAEIWDDIGPRAESVVSSGQATWDERLLLFLERRGFAEETYHTFSYSPVPDDKGGVGGMLCVVTEDTERTISERRLKTLRDLAARTTEEQKSAEEACQTAARTLAANPQDLPFVLLYLIDANGCTALRSGATGLPTGSSVAPTRVALQAGDTSETTWPLCRVWQTGHAEVVTGIQDWFGPFPVGVYPESPHMAAVLPLRKSGQDRLAGFLIAGISPRCPFDDNYRGFLDLLAGQIATVVSNARAYEEERQRAEALAKLDRAKTAFFSNVSHEFRTPLTLMLGPVEDALGLPGDKEVVVSRETLEVVHRNGLRLQKLVNTLLDFSRIEAGRVQASYEPTDLALFTADLASNFRSACQRAGLELAVHCPPLAEPVFVDRELWEKVVFNLLSNAFKYTLEGRIEVGLRQVGSLVELAVHDTGTGIPPDQVSHLFDRFHRVEGAKGRTQEGSGIGLALVRELVRLHGGEVRVESHLGQGSTFFVTVPLGKSHLPQDRIRASRTLNSTVLGATAYIEEALRWLPATEMDHPDPIHSEREIVFDVPSSIMTGERPCILLIDDNADMRDYLRRLLAGRYDVIALADGLAARAAAQENVPDLVLSDVMLPGLDGFGLLKALRADQRTAEVPVLLLSAKAGEEARVEGLQAGADDYLTKPFSARELLARVEAHLELAKLRRETAAVLRQNHERLYMALAASDTGTFRWEPSTERFVEFDENLKRLFGLVPGESVRTTADFLARVHPDDVAKVAAAAERSRQGANFEMEYRVILRGGGVRWLYDRGKMERDSAGQPTYLVGACTDITKRKQVEQALRDTAERLRLLWEAATVLLTTEDPDAMLRSLFAKIAPHFGLDAYFNFLVNEAGDGLRMGSCAGIPEEEAHRITRLEFGQAVCGTVALRRKPIIATYIQQSEEAMVQLVKGYGIRTYACNPLLVEGRLLGTLSFASRTRDDFEPDELEFLRTICHYVTVACERVRLMQQLRDQDRRKDEFLATLAHELRNPLAPIRNSLQILKMPRVDAAIIERSREMMERQVQHLVRLVDDLLDVSRVMRGKITLRRERIELAIVIARAIETVQPLMDAQGHELTVSLSNESLLLEADPVRLAQVVGNLLTNAAKYTEPRGQIFLTARREGDYAVLRVRDTGIGIAPEMLPKIFDLFVQVDHAATKSQGGLGIGLTLVRNLVEMHQGRAEARSAGLGQGSEFLVRLPLVVQQLDEPIQEIESKEPKRNGHLSRRRIVVVDDNVDAAESLAMLLRLQGHEVRVAHDGPSGLQMIQPGRQELVFLDIGMPGMDGNEVARRLRQQPALNGLVLVALTGWGTPEDRRRTADAGFDHHLVKPVEPAAVDQLLAGLVLSKG